VPSRAHVRPAVADDVEAIRSLVERAYGPWVPIVGLRPGPMGEDYEALVAEGDVFVLADPDVAGAVFLLADPDAAGAVVGVLVLRPDASAPGDDALMIENVAVDPDQQGRGLGRMLLDFAEDQARARGVGEMRLYTHERMTANIELYRRLGWQVYERRESDGFARVFMRKPVT
jgi:ribosomal protein S18 acetylase RimI-like enzyme